MAYNVLDVFLLFDLLETDQRILKKYLGNDWAAFFRALHTGDKVQRLF
jgi:hypothetical protein